MTKNIRILSALAFAFLFAGFFSPSYIYAASSVELLSSPWHLTKATAGADEQYEFIPSGIVKGTTSVKITYDLHGTCLFGGDASAVVFDQPVNQTWRYISLASYGSNCKNGSQTIDVPVAAFGALDVTKPVGILHVRVWNSKPFTVDISSIQAVGATGSTTSPSISPTVTPTITVSGKPTPTVSPTPPKPTVTPTPKPKQTWAIQSVSSMKETKDRICNQRAQAFIDKWVARAKELGANYVSVETPYDNPSCGNAVAYSKMWIKSIRAAGLKVWHRHMPMAFESIYDVPKSKSDYLNMINSYIKNNASDFAADDIFTPIPEPQNGGIKGVTMCYNNVCQYDSQGDFNAWLRNAISTSESAFSAIGLGGKMKIGYFGFDGFITWGDNNPDWDGILEDATIQKMGNTIAVDHYPQLVGSSMGTDLNELQSKYPKALIVISEWGTVASVNTEQQVKDTMNAAKRPNVVGFNYWQFGVGGNEALINEDLSKNLQFDEVQAIYKPS
jgi:hypothetical protein